MKTRIARVSHKKVVKSDPYACAIPKKKRSKDNNSSSDDIYYDFLASLEKWSAPFEKSIYQRSNEYRTVDTKGHDNVGHAKKNISTSSTKREKVCIQPIPSAPSTLFAQLQVIQDKDGFITNTKQFDCIICMTKIKTGNGVVLRDCLHQFCYDCTKNAIIATDDAEISCPFGDGKNRCVGIILDHEIRAIRSLRIAEAVIPNTVHCKKVDCVVWCICDDNVKQFFCGLCQSPNCVPCNAIHKGRNCNTFQNELKHNIDTQLTNRYLDDRLTKNKAMKCPKCQIIIMKRDGCDLVRCSMCRTEICWITKQARWGPNGTGDTSAGCRCGVGGKKCHPKCGFCH